MRSLLLLLVGVAAVVAGCASAADRAPLSAEATLKDKDGKQVGVATLIETPEGVHQLIMWTLPSKEKGARAVFERVAGSFEVVNPPKASALEKEALKLPRTAGTGTVEERLRAIFVNVLEVPAEKLKPEARFKEDLSADELDLVELVIASEVEFDIEIGDDDAEKLTAGS